MSLPTDSAGMELCGLLEAECERLRKREAKLVEALELVIKLVFNDPRALTKTIWVPESVHPNSTLLEHLQSVLSASAYKESKP